jgi:hypothetical protein
LKRSHKKFSVEIESYGLYSKWNKESRELPKIQEFTSTIQAAADNEFGMILRIRKGKGATIEYRIKHPPFKNDAGEPEPDFTGEYLVTSNDYHFYIGDSIREPVEDKKGVWQIIVYYHSEVVAQKKFTVQ